MTDSLPILLFRYQDADNHYWTQSDGSGMRIGKTVNGVRTELRTGGDNGPSRPPNTWYTATVEAIGSNIRGYVNGVKLVDIEDDSFSAGKVGMTASEPTAYDDVKVEDLNGGLQTYTYDPNGNMTGGAGRVIAWDSENRPLTITLSGITTTFVYDSDGRRVKKAETNGTTVTTTVYVGNYYEVTSNGTVTETVGTTPATSASPSGGTESSTTSSPITSVGPM